MPLACGSFAVGLMAGVGCRTHAVRLVAAIAEALNAFSLGLLALRGQLPRVTGALQLLVALARGQGAVGGPLLLPGTISLDALSLLACLIIALHLLTLTLLTLPSRTIRLDALRLREGLVVALKLLALTLAGSLLACILLPRGLFALLVRTVSLSALELFAGLATALRLLSVTLAGVLLARGLLARGLFTLLIAACSLLRLASCLISRRLPAPLLAVVVVFLFGVAAAGAAAVLGGGSRAHAQSQGGTQRDVPKGLLVGGKLHVGSLLGLPTCSWLARSSPLQP